MNKMKTVMLLGLLTALVIFIGQAIGGKNGFAIAIVLAVGMNAAAYWFSDKIALAMHRAKEMKPSEEPEMHAVVRKLAVRMGIPMPRLYLIPESAPNAFATGRNPQNAAVAVTSGLLQILDKDELEGVLAHELAHVQNRDTLIMTVAASIAGTLSMIADMALWSSLLGGRSSEDGEGRHPLAGILGIMVAPIAAGLIQMSISRTREFLADETGARATGKPNALGSALLKLESWSKKRPLQTATPATAHLFIMNPIKGGGFASLFSTHPSTKERVKRLTKLGEELGAVSLNKIVY